MHRPFVIRIYVFVEVLYVLSSFLLLCVCVYVVCFFVVKLYNIYVWVLTIHMYMYIYIYVYISIYIRPLFMLRIVRPRIFESKFRNHCAKKLVCALRKPTSFI